MVNVVPRSSTTTGTPFCECECHGEGTISDDELLLSYSIHVLLLLLAARWYHHELHCISASLINHSFDLCLCITGF